MAADSTAAQRNSPRALQPATFIPNYGEKGMLLSILRRILKRDKVDITEQDPTLKVIYLGNVVTTWAKSEGCLERPASALWRNHSNGRGSIKMTVSVTPSGLKAYTAEHGLTEYWANRLTWTGVPMDYPKLFCWIYRHEGRKLKQELRCHAVMCPTQERAVALATSLRNRLAEALFDFRREKQIRQNARLSIVQSLYPYQFCGSVHTQNYKPPLEKARAAPKLTAIEENEEPPPSPPPPKSPICHALEDCEQACTAPMLEIPESPIDGAEATNFVPQDSSIDTRPLNNYSKFMLHLLDIPPEGDNVGSEYPGSSNSDTVNDSSDSEFHEECRNGCDRDLNDDNISDESGYSEDAVESPISSESPVSGSDGSNSTIINRDSEDSMHGSKSNMSILNLKYEITGEEREAYLMPIIQPVSTPTAGAQPALVIFDNLSFEI